MDRPAIGRVDHGSYAGQFVSGQRTEVIRKRQGVGTGGKPNRYTFEMFDASDALSGAQVLILDGTIWGPNNDEGIVPDGMGGDNYELPVNNGDEIWVEIDWSGSDPETIVSASINHGPTTPDDTETTKYITIGTVVVSYTTTVPVVTPTNSVCGDIIIEIPPYPPSDKFVLMAKDGNLIWEDTTVCP